MSVTMSNSGSWTVEMSQSPSRPPESGRSDEEDEEEQGHDNEHAHNAEFGSWTAKYKKTTEETLCGGDEAPPTHALRFCRAAASDALPTGRRGDHTSIRMRLMTVEYQPRALTGPACEISLVERARWCWFGRRRRLR